MEGNHENRKIHVVHAEVKRLTNMFMKTNLRVKCSPDHFEEPKRHFEFGFDVC